ncbi:MAG: LytTR family DNA-binding domain-containing protein [Eubacteriales bacterium]
MLKIAICDDDLPICTQLKEIVKTHCTTKEIEFEVQPFYQGEELLKSLKNGETFDLIFLDIEINTITGIEVGSAIRNKLDDHITKIVFITSKQGYESALFDVQPLNFIKKPIDCEKVGHCIDLTVKLIKKEAVMFRYTVKKETFLIKVEKILYFESSGRKVKMVTAEETVSFYGSLEEIKNEYQNLFVYTHKSFLLNMSHCVKISPTEILLSNKACIPISRKYSPEVRKLLIQREREVEYGSI